MNVLIMMIIILIIVNVADYLIVTNKTNMRYLIISSILTIIGMVTINVVIIIVGFLCILLSNIPIIMDIQSEKE